MSCKNCAVKVENTFNSMDGVWAKVDLSKKEVIESATSMFDSLIDEFTKLNNEKV